MESKLFSQEELEQFSLNDLYSLAERERCLTKHSKNHSLHAKNVMVIEAEILLRYERFDDETVG